MALKLRQSESSRSGEVRDYSGAIKIVNTSQKVAPFALNARRWLLFVNSSAITLWIRFNKDAEIEGIGSIPIDPQEKMLLQGGYIPPDELHVVGNVINSEFTCLIVE